MVSAADILRLRFSRQGFTRTLARNTSEEKLHLETIEQKRLNTTDVERGSLHTTFLPQIVTEAKL
jgi:hypothetical protein